MENSDKIHPWIYPCDLHSPPLFWKIHSSCVCNLVITVCSLRARKSLWRYFSCYSLISSGHPCSNINKSVFHLSSVALLLLLWLFNKDQQNLSFLSPQIALFDTFPLNQIHNTFSWVSKIFFQFQFISFFGVTLCLPLVSRTMCLVLSGCNFWKATLQLLKSGFYWQPVNKADPGVMASEVFCERLCVSVFLLLPPRGCVFCSAACVLLCL